MGLYYFAEHMLLPQLLAAQGTAILDAIERGDPAPFVPIWEQAGFAHTPALRYQVHGETRVGIVTFPSPSEDTEAYLAVITAPPVRYFTWEKSIEFTLDGGVRPGTVIGEWSPRGHGNLGSGPPVTGNFDIDVAAIVERVLAVLR